MEVTDRDNCFPQTNLSEDAFDGNFTTYAMQCGYIPQYNTNDIRNQGVDALSGGTLELLQWVRLFMVLSVLGFMVWGVGKVIIEKVRGWTH